MSTPHKQPIIYVVLTFVLTGIAYFVFVYQSPITVTHTQHIEVEPSTRFTELLGKKELTPEEFEELKMESYNHWVKSSPGNPINFEQWKELFQNNPPAGPANKNLGSE